MNLEVFNTNFERIAICDNYESFIWTDRYNAYGDFELYFGMDKALLDIYQPDYYLVSDESEYTMIIEDLNITTDTETGNHLIVRGRSLESLLYRRIVWTQTILKGNLHNAIKKLITDNVTNPKLAVRKIENFAFIDSEDERILNLTIDETQFTGNILYDAIQKLCDLYNVGFKITLNADHVFEFRLYMGEDRSYAQNVNPYVVFSPTFENIINSNYAEMKSGYCNVTLVAGEGEGTARKTYVVGETDSTGIIRRELYTDARDISSTNDEQTISTAAYNNMLKNRGLSKLKEVDIQKEFEGQVETSRLYRYGEHFGMGDITELENEYDLETRVRVIEYIYSDSTSETTEYPTFEVVEEDESNGN